MRKSTKIWLVIAICLILVGCSMMAVTLHSLNWDLSGLDTGKYETNAYTVSQPFSNISVDTDTAEVIFALSPDGKCRVECFEEENGKHSVNVENDTLMIKTVNKTAWYDRIGIHLNTPKIKVNLPQKEYAALSLRGDTGKVELPEDFQFESVEILLTTGDVKVFASASAAMKIKTTTGNILVENTVVGELGLRATTGIITASDVACTGDLSVHISTGKTSLTNITCQNLLSEGDTGKIDLDNVVALKKFQIEWDTGDVTFTNSDAAEIYVETDTGDVTGSLLSGKLFMVETDTGRVHIPQSTTGGRCQIETDTGDIKITIK